MFGKTIRPNHGLEHSQINLIVETVHKYSRLQFNYLGGGHTLRGVRLALRRPAPARGGMASPCPVQESESSLRALNALYGDDSGLLQCQVYDCSEAQFASV